MSNHEKATPRPWEVQKLRHCGGELWLQIGQGGWGPITELNGKAAPPTAVANMKWLVASDEEQEANATLIVEAVNNYDRLRRIEKLAGEFVNGYLDAKENYPQKHDCSCCEKYARELQAELAKGDK